MQEIWKDCLFGIKGYYQVSNFGRVKTMPRIVKRGNGTQKVPEKILKTRIDKNGYEFLGLYIAKKKQVFKKVHNLVATSFIENKENKKCVNHINGIKKDNRVENLEWVTYRENSIHAIKNNLVNTPKGERHPFTNLLNEDVLFIRKMKGVESSKNLAKKFNVCTKTINNILNKTTWKHI